MKNIMVFAIAFILPACAWSQTFPEPYNGKQVVTNFAEETNPIWDWQKALDGGYDSQTDHFALIGFVEAAYVGYDDLVYVSVFTTTPVKPQGFSDGPCHVSQ